MSEDNEIQENENLEAFLEKTPFIEAFGSTPKTRVLIFLMAHMFYDYSIDELMTYTGIKAWKTMSNALNSLVKFGFVIPTRKIERTQMYKLDSNDIVESLFAINEHLIDVIIDEETKKLECDTRENEKSSPSEEQNRKDMEELIETLDKVEDIRLS